MQSNCMYNPYASECQTEKMLNDLALTSNDPISFMNNLFSKFRKAPYPSYISPLNSPNQSIDLNSNISENLDNSFQIESLKNLKDLTPTSSTTETAKTPHIPILSLENVAASPTSPIDITEDKPIDANPDDTIRMVATTPIFPMPLAPPVSPRTKFLTEPNVSSPKPMRKLNKHVKDRLFKKEKSVLSVLPLCGRNLPKTLPDSFCRLIPTPRQVLKFNVEVLHKLNSPNCKFKN